jgi:hypothetical protein
MLRALLLLWSLPFAAAALAQEPSEPQPAAPPDVTVLPATPLVKITVYARPPRSRGAHRSRRAGSGSARTPSAPDAPGAGNGAGQGSIANAATGTGVPDVASEPVTAPSMASQMTVTGTQLNAQPLARPGEILEATPGLIVTQHSGEGKANQYFLGGYNLDHGTDLAIKSILSMTAAEMTHSRAIVERVGVGMIYNLLSIALVIALGSW